MTVIFRHPFLTYTLIGFVSAAAVHLADLEYDAGGIASVLFLLPQLFLLPLIACREVLIALSGGIVSGWHSVVSGVFQLVLCLCLDVLVARFQSGSRPAPSED